MFACIFLRADFKCLLKQHICSTERITLTGLALHQGATIALIKCTNLVQIPALDGMSVLLMFLNLNQFFRFTHRLIHSSSSHVCLLPRTISSCLLTTSPQSNIPNPPPQLCYRQRKSPSIRHNHHSRSMIVLKANFQSMRGRLHLMHGFSLSRPTSLSVETKAIYSSPKALLATAS